MSARGAIASLLSALVLAGPATVAAQQTSGDVVARVGSTAVTLGDVDAAWRNNDPSSQLRLLQQLYETRRRALEIVIGDLLIDREARARGMSRDALLAEALPARTRPVTDAEIDDIYERNKDRFGGRTLEQMRPEIRAVLEQQRPLDALHAYMGELRLAADDVQILLDPPRQLVETRDDDPSLGPATAPVRLVEFSDFECPFCQRLTGTLAELRNRFGDRILIVFKDFPLPSHPHALKAAEAGRCAHEQGRFWPYHDQLYASQRALEVADLKRYAADLGLDAAAINRCLDEGRFASRVRQDLTLGQSYGVSSTPTIFINGRLVMGAVPLEVFEDIIREELARAAGR